ncbi:pirin-like C-terminal cupin domain-containing protein [Nitrosomonas ureae]|uniref:pirin-like C-terminal cupin domain-containing protein n=1 Tax=Nitrosomonas ureae TaxID=44577 RepID=UPI0026827386
MLPHSLVILDTDDHSFDFIAGKKGARFIVISGQPINEPIARYGPFVMNTREEIDQAMRDFQTNTFVRDRAWIKRNR